MDNQVRERVQNFLSGVNQIPTLPDVYLKVKKAFEDPTMSIEYLSDAIRFDQALTVSLLRLANSPLFGYRAKISSIGQAIMLIGLRELYSLVLSVSVMGLFPIKEDEAKSLYPAKKYWEQSIATAVTAKNLASLMNYPRPDELFVAGLIHDIGILMEKMYLGDKFVEICQKAKDSNKFLIDVEAEELGFTHAEVGQILTETWQFPPLLVMTTGHHHQPNRVKEDGVIMDAIAIVHVAEALVRGMDFGWPGDQLVTPVDLDAIKRLHLVPWQDMEVVMGKIEKEYKLALEALVTAS